MVRIAEEFKDTKDVRMLLQVHDELVFEVKRGTVEKHATRIRILMEEAEKLAVPLRVEVKHGRSWGELEQVK
jgi:DNA polymerase-1